jgi:hypothetical protein
MSIASDAPAAHTPSVMRSVSLHRKIRGRCVRSSVSLGAASYGKRRKVSITIRLRRYATSGGGEHESRSERSSRGSQEILRMEAAMPRTARSGGVSGMLHRTTARRADLIEGTVDSLVRNRGVSTADPRSRLLGRGPRKQNTSHRAADGASSLVSASNTKSSRASIAGPS